MAERSLVDRVMREQEEVGLHSAQLLLAEVVEDLRRQLEELEADVRERWAFLARAPKGTLP